MSSESIKRPLRILFLASDLRAIGGIQRYNASFLKALAEEGNTITVVELFRKSVPFKSLFLFHFFLKSLMFRPRFIFCSHINFVVPVCLVKKIFRLEYVVFTYGIEAWEISSTLKLRALQEAKAVITISSYTRDRLLEQAPSLKQKLFVINNPVDGEEFAPRDKSKALVRRHGLDDQKIILTISRLSIQEQYKGYDLVIKALPRVLASVPNALYVLIGKGDDKERIQRFVADLHLEEHVMMIDPVSESEIADYYNLCDVFVMPSSKEGFGFVFIEALACGKPVVAANQGGSRDAVLNGELGILVDPSKIDEIADALIGILQKDVASRLVDGVFLRRRVLEQYSYAVFKKNISIFINALVFAQKPEDFETSISLPASAFMEERWQEANIAWWERNPMSYDWREKIPYEEFTKAFYKEVDRRFFTNAEEYMPWRKIPFDSLIDFETLKGKDVLEIGVGNGSHAALLARYAKSFTGIDITEYAVKSTTERFRLFDLSGRILRMDAEQLNFSDKNFDFVWSWGVIHHSANTENIIREIQRVLRPGGTAVIMVYHRGWWNYYARGFLQGLISGDLFRFASLHKVIQLRTDGAIARYYSVRDWKALVKGFFDVAQISIYGPKSDIVLLPNGAIKNFLINFFPGWLSRFFTGKLNMGGFLVGSIKKAA